MNRITQIGMASALGAILALGVTVDARAADAIVPEAPAPAPNAPSAPIYVWSGPYAGAFVGYNTTKFDQSGGADFDDSGFVGGVYGGYSFQSGSFVYGVEGDVGGSDISASGFNAAAGSPVEADTGVFGSLRARAGVAVDPFLVFATGGVAASRNELKLGGSSDSKTSVGFTLGAGVETKITDSVTTRLEYRYSDYGSQTYDLGNTAVSSGFDEHSIRAGIALKF